MDNLTSDMRARILERRNDPAILRRELAADVEWGLYWHKTANEYEGAYAPACAHNEAMTALHIMALEAVI